MIETVQQNDEKVRDREVENEASVKALHQVLLEEPEREDNDRRADQTQRARQNRRRMIALEQIEFRVLINANHSRTTRRRSLQTTNNKFFGQKKSLLEN